MTEKIFPVVRISEKIVLGDLAWPRSRERAFLQAARERCFFLGDWPDELPEHFSPLRRCHRASVDYGGETLSFAQLDQWEDLLASPYSSEVLTEGEEVLSALEPAMKVCQTVYAIDPYLFSFNSYTGVAYSDGLKHLLKSKPKTFQAVMSVEEDSVTERISSIIRWLRENDSTSTALTIYLTARSSFHDRFLAFCNKLEDQSWLAVSVGYGLKALAPGPNRSDRHKPTCLARISSAQFSKVWTLAQKQSRICLVSDSSNAGLGGGWREESVDQGIRIYRLDGTVGDVAVNSWRPRARRHWRNV